MGFDYWDKEDLLYVFKDDTKADHSIELDRFVIDMTHSGDITGLEIFEVKELIKIMGFDVDLSEIKNAELRVGKGKNTTYVIANIVFSDGTRIPIQVQSPMAVEN